MTQIALADTLNTAHPPGVAYLKANYASPIQTAPFKTNDVGGLANSLANRLQTTSDPNYPNGKPLAVAAGLPSTFFQPYPQYLGGLYVLQTRHYSNYNGAQVHLQKRSSLRFLF